MKKIILMGILLTLHAQANDFAFKLYQQLSTTKGNLFFSPSSIEAALAMTQEGAAGNTLIQFFQCLENSDTPTLSVPSIGTNVTLENANAIWVDQTFPLDQGERGSVNTEQQPKGAAILETFKNAVTKKHNAEIRAADFAGQPEVERLKINQWVEEKTRDKIQDLLPDGSVDAMTRLLLVNAIYFKGDWLHAFDPEQTVDAPFRLSPDESVPVPMMPLKETRFAYGENDCFQTLELPYEGEEVSMLLILPKAENGLKHIEECFAPGNLDACTKGMRKRDVNVFLPRFKVESTFASLKRDLAALGLTDAFDAQLADFSGISPEPLFISDVVHKAFVEVNEEGTEAAAATGIIMRTTSIHPPPVTFRADRPFIFLIRENKSGKILFMGRITNPSK